ncbi:MAG TPA: hypothetical protein VGL94_08080 [Ktedonobacteraceae bacterium]
MRHTFIHDPQQEATSFPDPALDNSRQVKHEEQQTAMDKALQTHEARELAILYDLYDLKEHSRIKCGDQTFTVRELLDDGWTVDQIVKQRYI